MCPLKYARPPGPARRRNTRAMTVAKLALAGLMLVATCPLAARLYYVASVSAWLSAHPHYDDALWAWRFYLSAGSLVCVVGVDALVLWHLIRRHHMVAVVILVLLAVTLLYAVLVTAVCNQALCNIAATRVVTEAGARDCRPG